MRRFSATLLAACCAAPTLLVAFSGTAFAAPFTANDVVVLRDGTGAAALSNVATATFLDEYSPTATSQTPIQTIALPTVASGANLAVTDSGSATSDGQITNSGDGQSILVPGYNAPVGTASVASSSSATYARVVAKVAPDGTVDSSTSNAAFSGNNFRSATVGYFGGPLSVITVGGTSGVQTQSPGSSSSSLLAGSASANLRAVHAYATQIFVSGSSTGSVTGVGVVTGSTITPLSGVSAANAYGFALARTGNGPTFQANGKDTGLDTVYVADATNGLYKYVYGANGTWSAVGSPIAGAYYGLAARPSSTAGATDIFLTTTSSLLKITDTSSGALSGTPTTLATAATNEAFRGVAFSPPAPSTSLPEAPYVVLLPLIGVTAIGAIVVRRNGKKALA